MRREPRQERRPDRRLRAGNADDGIVAEFDTPADLRHYRDHPAHQRVLREVLLTLVATRQTVQLEVS